MELIDKILEESKSLKEDSSEFLEFCSQAFLALSAVDSNLVKKHLESTGTYLWFKDQENKVSHNLKNKKFQFFYELKTLQVIDNGVKNHYKLLSAKEILQERNLNLQIEGIISRGFLLQMESYQVINLALNL